MDALHETAAAHALRKAVNGGGGHRTSASRHSSTGERPLELRDLLEPAPAGEPVPLDEVEPVESIVRRFSGGAMSHGALSAEAHETVAIALNSIGARRTPARAARTRRATGRPQLADQAGRVRRFGVTPEYLAFAEELQIKIAQGSKPGEGGQLPGTRSPRRSRACATPSPAWR